ncbi:MAG: hypothetical protein OEV72_07470 [Thermoleophilia bacterium]|nr:hypothetical protein [Thermoleophilia bacterium]
MCSLCGVMSKEHWAELGDGRRARVFRAAVLNRVLEHFGLSAQAWAGSQYVLRDRKGGTAVVSDLGALWVEAERLHGAPLDPLAADLLAALES